MKKLLVVLPLVLCLILTGCGKYGESDIVKDFAKKVDGAKGYQVKGELEITNNDDTYRYDVTVDYKKKDMYKVSLKNKANNHEQIILKNSEGVYVLTPSLNKSFKFQSDWPYNNSQVYLLQSLVNDMKSDTKRSFKENDKNYVFTTTVNYPNNRKLTKQTITLDQKLVPTKVQVLSDDDIPQMTMNFTSVDFKATFDDDHFQLEEAMKSAVVDESSIPTGSLDDIVYPLYLPSGTKLSNQDKIEKTNGERIILSFDGEKPFLLVEETVSKEEELTVIPTFGDPYVMADTVGAITNNSITWTSNGIEYYIVSDVMNPLELVEIAKSINVIPTMK